MLMSEQHVVRQKRPTVCFLLCCGSSENADGTPVILQTERRALRMTADGEQKELERRHNNEDV